MKSLITHGTGFLASGVLAFATDALCLAALTRVAGLDPFSARLLAIEAAMVVAYFAHRSWTFRVNEPASLMQFLKFVSVAAASSALNYAIYAAQLLAWPSLDPLIALAIASAVSMLSNYLGFRFGVFRQSEF
jgi:putative flippase GtrA